MPEENIYARVIRKSQYNPTSRTPGERQQHIAETPMQEFLGHTPHDKADQKPWSADGVNRETARSTRRDNSTAKRIKDGIPKRRYTRKRKQGI